jgi:disulfide bond formation protein DsbB
MNKTKPLLIIAAIISLALLGVGVYLQHVQQMAPCPLCVIQRYAFAAVAIICLIAVVLPYRAARIGAGLGMLAALAGIGVAARHLWVKANPDVSCGIDPLETSLNRFPTAELMPYLFKADGFCTTEYAPIIGLSIPQWALIWFIVLAIMLGVAAFRRRPR